MRLWHRVWKLNSLDDREKGTINYYGRKQSLIEAAGVIKTILLCYALNSVIYVLIIMMSEIIAFEHHGDKKKFKHLCLIDLFMPV